MAAPPQRRPAIRARVKKLDVRKLRTGNGVAVELKVTLDKKGLWSAGGLTISKDGLVQDTVSRETFATSSQVVSYLAEVLMRLESEVKK